MQVGNIATAYFTVAIAFHTFNSLVLRKRQSIYVYGPTILLGWVVSLVLGEHWLDLRYSISLHLMLGFLPLISNLGPVYGPSGLACGVRASLKMQLFFFHLLPVSPSVLVVIKRQTQIGEDFLGRCAFGYPIHSHFSCAAGVYCN